MTPDERLKTAVETATGYLVHNGVAFEHDPVYYVMNIAAVPTCYADDDAQYERLLGQLNLYAPLDMNITALKRTTKRSIHSAGFTWPSAEDLSDNEGRHIVFEFEDAEAADYGED